jgi:ATP-dependent RNA helicase RhlE
MSMQSFATLGVSDVVVRALSSRGITAPFAIQQDVIGDVLAGRDVLARSPTGSGKTLAFGIPLVDRTAADARRPAVLVLAPTRELATQIVDEIRPIAHARALKIAAVYGGVGLLKQAQTASRAHIVVATPGRLEDQIERGAFTLDHVRTLVIDEADRMLDMGFKPALDRIVTLCSGRRQTLFFSATLDGEAGKAARRYTTDAVFHEHGPSERRASDDVEHRFVEVSHDSRLDSLLEQLSGKRDLALVFVRTKHGADKLVKKLSTNGVEAVAMHGNKTQRQRERALAQFEAYEVDTLVATDVAARGIDVGGISHVINFDPPHDSETYVHRVGRTGRAGATGVGITLVSPDQRRDVAQIAGELDLEHGLVDTRPSVGAGGFKRGSGSPQGSSGHKRSSGHRTGGSSHRPGGQGHKSAGAGHKSAGAGHRPAGQGHQSGPGSNRPSGSGYKSASGAKQSGGQSHRTGGRKQTGARSGGRAYGA